MLNSKLFIFASVAVCFVSWTVVLGRATDEVRQLPDTVDFDPSEEQDVYFTHDTEDENEENDEDELPGKVDIDPSEQGDVPKTHEEEATEVENEDIEGSTGSGSGDEFSDPHYMPCRCWIGQKYNKSNMIIDFGIVKRYPYPITAKRMSTCDNRCIEKFNEYLKVQYPETVKNALCVALDKEYRSDQPDGLHLGCFSQLGNNENCTDVWKTLSTLPDLRCELKYSDCVWMFGEGYTYHQELKRCVRTLIENDPNCIAGVEPGDNTHPVCCSGGNIYHCLKPRQLAVSY